MSDQLETNEPRKSATDKSLVLHEVGHAIGFALTAEERGIPWRQAIDSITIEAPNGGAVIGPNFPDAVSDAIAALPVPNETAEAQRLWGDVAARTGYDMKAWAKAAAFIAMGGAILEGAFGDSKPQSASRIFFGPGCEDDFDAFSSAALFSSLASDDAGLRELADDTVARWRATLGRLEVRRAIQSLATHLACQKTLTGSQAMKVLTKELRPETAHRFNIRSATAEFKPKLDQVWRVDDVLPAGAVCVIDGKPGVGKTFNLTDLLMAVARGVEWHGRRTQQSPVLYVAAEDEPTNRVAAYLKHHGLAGVPDFHMIADTVNMHHGQDDRRDLIRAALEVGAKVVAIDTLAAAMTGGDENSSEGMGKVLAAARELRNLTGATVIFVHHQGKDASKGARGHSSLEGAIDTRIEADEGVLTVRKQRNGRAGDKYGFDLVTVELGQDPRGKTVTSCVSMPKAMAAAQEFQPPKGKAGLALTALEDLAMGGEPVTVDAWRAEFGRKYYPTANKKTRSSAFTRAVESLTTTGHVTIDGAHARSARSANGPHAD